MSARGFARGLARGLAFACALALALLASPASSSSSSPSSTSSSPATLSVDCVSGRDADGDGTPSKPFLSLTRARDAVRAAQPLSGPLSVLVAGDCPPRDAAGNVDFTQAAALTLGAQDSGSAAAPVTWTAAPGRRARVVGGKAVPAALWSPAPGRPGVFVADLGPAGLDVAKYGFGSLAAGGLGTCEETAMELFFNGSAAVLARFPNLASNGTWEFMNIGRVVDPASAFSVNGSAGARALTWANEPLGWLHGYWSYDWADSYVEIASITDAGDGNTLLRMNASTAPVYGFLPTARFYATNLLSELDAPLEYFIDVSRSLLYFMPPGGDPTAAEAVLSLANYGVATDERDARGRVPFKRARAHFLDNELHETPAHGEAGVLSFMSFVGIDVQFCRVAGIALAGVANCSVSDLDSSQHGHNSVTVSGTGNSIARITASGTGCEACSMYGGDTSTLAPGGNAVMDSNISFYARTIRTYNPAIGFGGVGNSYLRNRFFFAPHNGMLGGAVSTLVEGNVFDTLCFEATDSGAFYIGRSWTNRGVVLRGNSFLNIRNREHMTLGYASVQAIYLDDQQSGTSIVDNVCVDSQTCWFVGGGRDTLVSGNECRGVVDTCVHIDDRGLNWQLPDCSSNATYTGALVQQLFNVKYQQPPYSLVFPEIVDTLSRRPCTPVNITVTANTYCNQTTKTFIDMSSADTTKYGDFVSGNAAVAC